MALIKCPKCKHEISDTTKKCIHCKTKIKSNNNALKINYKLVIPISIISLFLIISFIAYKIDDNKIHYNDKKQNIEEVQTNDENNLNNNQEDSNNNSDIVENNSNSDNEKEENKGTTTNNNSSTNNNANSNNNNISNNNNTSSNNNSNTNNKIIIDATENKNCPSGYTYEDGSIYADAPCKKTDITNGTLIYSCPGDYMVLVGDKCEMTFTEKPYNGNCYGTGYVLNGDVCEKKELLNAMLSGLQCPSGYKKYVIDKKDTRCYKSEFVKQDITYSCPSGYTLNGNKCVK